MRPGSSAREEILSNPDPTTPSLRRTFGLVTLVAFGIGDILGAGIYGLIGNVAREVGSAVWASFLVAFVVAAFTGLSYAELGSRLPHSGGEARYAENAFRRKWLAYVVGFLVLLSGLVSISTVSHIFANYLTVEGGLLPGLPGWIVRLVFLLGIGVITYWGIRQSSATNVVCTLVEMGGLLVVVVVALPSFGSVDYFEFPAAEGGAPFEGVPVWALLGGGVLAFYSFIGFEDLANVAEEVKNPRRNLPRAIVIALAIAAVFYGLVSIAAVSSTGSCPSRRCPSCRTRSWPRPDPPHPCWRS
jgi:amino acid transporter